MRIADAEYLIRCLVLRPGYTVEPVKSRFEGKVRLDWTIQAHNSDRDQAAQGYPNEIPGGVKVTNHVRVDDIDDSDEVAARIELARRIVHILLHEIEAHEWREFLRYSDYDYWAPLHPHRNDGIEAFGTPELDLRYGVS